FCVAILLAQDFRITEISALNGKVILRHTADTNYYYILYRGDVITNIVLASDMAVATNTVGELADQVAPSGSNNAFYRILAVPIIQPRDSDADGIDDVYELRHKDFLNPLNPTDATQDFDKDGITNLQEYRAGTDPTMSEWLAPTVTAPVSPTKELNI